MTDPDERRAKLLEGWKQPQGVWTIRTIADFLASGHGVRVDCRACRHWTTLDLVSLGERMGRDADVYRIIERLACSAEGCGAKKPGITITSPHTRMWATDP
jgi:hypothetical protein